MAAPAVLAAPGETHTKKPSAKKKMDLETFLATYGEMEDGYKYEFDQGTIEKTLRTMTPAQSFILNNLMRRFLSTQAFKDGGNLFVEIEMKTKPDQIRKPDIAYRSAEQIATGDYSVSSFAVEIISKHDTIAKIKKKTREYFAAGMKTLWLIYPELEEVEVFTTPRKSRIFAGKEKINAKPAITDFSLKAEDVFVKPIIAKKAKK